MSVNSVLILIAMEAEAKPFLDFHNLQSITLPSNVPSQAYQGLVKNCTVTVVVNGKDKTSGVDNVGTVPGMMFF